MADDANNGKSRKLFAVLAKGYDWSLMLLGPLLALRRPVHANAPSLSLPRKLTV
jgi:hypothetical protein